MLAIDLTLYAPLIGFAAKYITGFIRNSPHLGIINKDSQKSVLAVAALVSTIATFATAWATGNLTEDITKSLIETTVSSIEAFASAVALHEATKKSSVK